MPVEGVNGILNVESAALHAPQVGVANTNPQHILSVGSNLYVSGDSSDVLTVDGNVVCEGVKVGLIEITPSYDLAAVSNVGNVTSNTIQFTNPDTGIVATGNVTVGSTLTVSGFRITAQAEANDDLEAITLAGADTAQAIHITNATDSVSPFTGALQIGTNTGNNGGLGVAGNVHVGQGMYVTSNLEVGTANLFVDSTTSRVGIGKTNPATALDVDGTVTATAFVGELAASRIAGTLAVTSGGTGTTTSTGTGSVVRSIAPTFTGTTTFSGEVDVNNHLNVTGNTFYTKPTSIHVDSNVVAEYTGPHGRGVAPLKKFPEIIFEEGKFDYNTTTNTFVQAGYTITSSGNYSDDVNSDYTAWRAFTGLINLFDPGWVSPFGSYTSGVANSTQSLTNIDTATSTGSVSSRNGAWIKLELPTKIKLGRVDFYDRYDDIEGTETQYERVSEAFVYGGNNNSGPWYEIGKQSDATNLANYTDNNPASLTIDTTSYYKYYIIQPTQLAKTISYASYGQLMFYGYEELATQGDTSVDTTFKSVLNTPQTTGANVYTDAKLSSDFTNQVTGPTPVGTAAVHDNTNKYWEMNGQLTSNITVEANTFLEGDQPHAVSVWFNSSNLEANVSNTCVFSVSDQEKLDSVNLDLQSNTWHNLTYAYQGEGGSRVTYLDGRKVAEDQAEDTFGEYPPFAMTGYSQGGYVVSASGELSATDNSHNIFDKDISDSSLWTPSASGYDASTGAANSTGSITLTDGVQGHWVQLDLPHKLKLNYVGVAASSIGTRYAKDATIFGSNDGVSWTSVGGWTDNTHASNTLKYFTMNGDSGYYNKYRLVVTKNGPSAALTLTEWKLYGHRENDLVRLPDPTNVLKYPHIAMTGPAQRGYVASSQHSFDSTRVPYQAFNELPVGTLNNGWSTLANTFDVNGNAADVGVVALRGTFGSYTGHWIKLELPHKLRLENIYIGSRDMDNTDKRQPVEGAFFGSNNDSTWDLLHAFSASSNPLSFTDLPGSSVWNFAEVNTLSASNTNYYKYIVLVVTKINASTQFRVLQIQDLKYYGTGVDSVPIQIGGGNIDKVANFRVYDRFVGEDQALEIWDTQKDEFGRAKSSMTLHKGRLGLGTTEPEGRLAVLDEPSGLEEFPPRAMTSNETYFEGHGVFKTSVSEYSGSTFHEGWNAFAHGAAEFWLMGDNAGYNLGSGEYEDNEFQLSSETSMGQWIKLEMPYLTNVTKFILKPRTPGAEYQAPKSGELWGSKDNYTWTKLHTFTDIQYYQGHTIFNFENSGFYKYYGLVVTKVGGGSSIDYISIIDLRYFGTREQGQSVLHDGQLTLTKSLNVPRIGPALDADDTPRRDRLVVEYNTSTNPTFEGAVRDTSGRGLDGIINSSVTYDSRSKEFNFAGDNDWIESPALGWTGAQPHSVSVWIKLDVMSNPNSTSIQNAWTIRKPNSTDAVSRISELHIFSNGTIEWAFNGNNNTTAVNKITAGIYYHIVCVYNGGAGNAASSRRMWINGVEETFATVSSTASAINFYDTATFAAGYDQGIDNYDLDGKMSSIKLYDTALTAQEVKTLYDMGRCDEGHHMVNFSKTRVGIGLGDGEAPRGALDVRGDIYGGMPVFFDVRFTSSPTATYAGNRIVWDTNNDSRGGGFDTATGTFTAPIGGVYKFSYWARGNQANQGIKMKPRINGSPTFNTTNDGTDQNLRGTAFMGNDGISGSAWTIVPLEAGGTFDLFACSHGTTVTSSLATFYNGFTGEYISSL